MLIYLPVFFALGHLHALPGFFGDYLLAVLTSGLLWLLLSARDPFLPEALSVRASRELARFSYTLYAVHIPFLVFILSLLAGDARWYPSPGKIIVAVGVLFAVLLYAYGLAFLTEFRTDALRYRLEHLFGIAPAPPALPSNPLSHAVIHQSITTESESKTSTTVR